MSRRFRKHSQHNRAVQVLSVQQQAASIDMSEKANPNYFGSVTYSNVPEPRQMPRQYGAYSKEGYKAVDVIYKCVQYIITNGAAIRPVLFTDDGMIDKIEKHPLLDKLKRPNPEQGGVTYRKAVLGYFLIAGNSFQYTIRNKNAPPDELWTLQPDKVEPVISRPRGIIGYKFSEFDDSKNPIPVENIGFLHTWNPDDATFGTSPLEPGAIKADMQTAALKWNLSLMQNQGKMSGAWSTDAILSPNGRSKLEERLNNKFAGYRNAGRIPVLDGGLKWNQMSVPPAQMDWLDGLKYNAGSLANLYNIPPQLIGDTSSTTYDNMQEAKAASYTEGIFPILDELYDLWNMWLIPMYPDLSSSGAYLYYDKDSVEVVQAIIQQQKDAKAKRAFQSWALGATSSCTLNEAREMQGLPPDPQGDVYRFGQVIVKVGELDKYAEQSLQKPAAAPMPVPEPELNVPTPGGPGQPPATPPTQNQDDNQQPPKKPPAASNDDTEATGKKPGKKGLSTKQKGLADFQDGTHGMWECAPGACAFCMENDGQIVPLGDDFPNGCTSPDDCHNFCKCSLSILSIPDGTDTSDMSNLALATLFGIGVIAASRGEDDGEQADTSEVDYAEEGDDEESKSRGKPGADISFAQAIRDLVHLGEAESTLLPDEVATDAGVPAKGMNRAEYRRFMESTLR